jgi:hypothetical protein
MTLHLALLVVTLLAPPQDRPADCGTWENCRQLALQAAEQQDFEGFHDLAWRAMRKGPPRNADLMRMLARAQSLSGRPLDAMVMLERLLEMGVVTDAATNDDFRRVRALSGWAEFEKRVESANAPPVPSERAASPGDRPPDAAAAPAGAAASAGAARGRRGAKGSPAGPDAGPGGAASAAAGGAAEALRFTTLAFTPAGLAYDRVSNRFIVGDFESRKLTVVDEASQRVANLAAAASAGFGTITALEIDAHEGDLWVVSSPAGSAGAEGEPTAATLHKLQLISGRVLYAVPLEASFGAARFADVAVTPRSSVLVLDAQGRRVFTAPPKARRLELALTLNVTGPASLAPQSDTVVYVAHASGIVRADLAKRRARPLTGGKSIDLSGFTRLRVHGDGLIGVQRSGNDGYRVVRLTLDGQGTRVTALTVLDQGLQMPDPTAAALAGDVFYYLADGPSSAQRAETIVRRVTVK